MSLGKAGSRLRCLAVWTMASLALGLTVLLTGGRTRAIAGVSRGAGLAGTPLDVALTDMAAALLLACAGWLWLVTTVVAVEAARGVAGDPGARRGLPSGVRRLVLAACGVALVGGLAQPSYAVTGQIRSAGAGPPSHRGLAGLPLPDRAVARRAPRSAGHPPPARATVVVAPGDTLWAIAVRVLPAHSPDARIAARWQEIYAANRSLIGPDPDLIVPGQRLLLPGKDPS